METVTIIAPVGYQLNARERLAAVGEVREVGRRGDGEIVVHGGASRVYIGVNRFARTEFGQTKLREIEARVPSPTCYSVDYSNIELCKSVVSALADDPRLLVDNDHGTLLPGDEFVARLRERPDWDWRPRSGG